MWNAPTFFYVNKLIILPSGSNRRVTPYSFSTTWNAVSSLSRGRADRAFRQSSKSGRFR